MTNEHTSASAHDTTSATALQVHRAADDRVCVTLHRSPRGVLMASTAQLWEHLDIPDGPAELPLEQLASVLRNVDAGEYPTPAGAALLGVELVDVDPPPDTEPERSPVRRWLADRVVVVPQHQGQLAEARLRQLYQDETGDSYITAHAFATELGEWAVATPGVQRLGGGIWLGLSIPDAPPERARTVVNVHPRPAPKPISPERAAQCDRVIRDHWGVG